MIFTETQLDGVYVIEPERLEDERGFFARTWSIDEFEVRRLDIRLVQCNVSYNKHHGTLRGMHYQVAPHEEVKLVRCTMGAIFDVAIDLRTASQTYKRWVAVELNAENRLILYLPSGCAHGFLTLSDDSEVFYQMSEFYHPECARGVRWDDPTFNIGWPAPPQVISVRDRGFPDFRE